jgi:hypothetical protein
MIGRLARKVRGAVMCWKQLGAQSSVSWLSTAQLQLFVSPFGQAMLRRELDRREGEWP